MVVVERSEATANRLLLFGVVLIACGVACSDLSKESPRQEAKQDAPCSARYVPVGNNPDIALDTQTGSLCRTIATAGPSFLDAQGKKLGPVAGDDPAGNKNPDKYASLPACDTRRPFQSFSDWKKSQDAKK